MFLEEPKVEFVSLSTDDIICTSGGGAEIYACVGNVEEDCGDAV